MREALRQFIIWVALSGSVSLGYSRIGSQEDSHLSVELQWLDPSGQVLDLPWRTAGSWDWKKEKKGGFSPVYQLEIQVPESFHPDSKVLRLPLSSPLATIRLSHQVPPMERSEGGLSVRVVSEGPIVLVHPDCDSAGIKVSVAPEETHFFFLGLSCQKEKGKWQAFLSCSEDAKWEKEEIGSQLSLSLESGISQTVKLRRKKDLELVDVTVRLSPELPENLALNAGVTPKQEAFPLFLSGALSAGELLGDSKMAELHEFHLFADMGVGWQDSDRTLSAEVKASLGVGSFVSSLSRLLRADAFFGFRFWNSFEGSLTIQPGFRYFYFQNAEMSHQPVSLWGPELALVFEGRVPWKTQVELSTFNLWAQVAPLGSTLGPISFDTTQWEAGLSLPFALRERNRSWDMFLRFSRSPESPQALVSLSVFSLGVSTQF